MGKMISARLYFEVGSMRQQGHQGRVADYRLGVVLAASHANQCQPKTGERNDTGQKNLHHFNHRHCIHLSLLWQSTSLDAQGKGQRSRHDGENLRHFCAFKVAHGEPGINGLTLHKLVDVDLVSTRRGDKGS